MREAEDREALRLLLARYNIAGDRGRRAEFAGVFADDAVLTLPWSRLHGRNAIVRELFEPESGAKPHAAAAKPAFVRHHLTTSKIDLDGDEAYGRTYFLVLTEIGLDHSGVYVDRFTRRGGEWLIIDREVRLDFVAPDTRMLARHRELLKNQRAARARR
jgi:hypothetical protein